MVDAFLAAARGGDINGLLAVLDPDVLVRTDGLRLPNKAQELRGAAAVAEQLAKGGARAARAAMVNGSPAVIVAPRGRLLMVILFTIVAARIVAIEVVSDPERLEGLDLALPVD